MKRLFLVVAAIAACSKSAPPETAAPKPVVVAAPAKSAGRVETRHFHSDALGVDKDYVVWLPADYDAKPAVHFPVFYYLHGLTGNEQNWVKGGHLDQVAADLGLEAIVVMPDGDDGFYTDAVTPVDYDACMKDGTGLFIPQMQPRPKTCVRQRNYETYIVKDLLAEVDGHFRTIASRDGRALAGMSMGGFGALELALRHQDLFSAAASHSGVDALTYAGPHPYAAGKVQLLTDPSTFGRTGDPTVNQIGAWMRGIFGPDLANWKAHDPARLIDTLQPGKLALYLDCGTEDGFALNDEATYLHDLLLAKQLDHEYFLGPGRHDFSFWTPRLPFSLKFLRDHTTAPKPS